MKTKQWRHCIWSDQMWSYFFFNNLLPATLGCSDFVYGEISSIPTKLIPNPVSKLLWEKSHVYFSFEQSRSLPNVIQTSHYVITKLICIPNSIWIGQWESDENRGINLWWRGSNSGGGISDKNANVTNTIPK